MASDYETQESVPSRLDQLEEKLKEVTGSVLALANYAAGIPVVEELARSVGEMRRRLDALDAPCNTAAAEKIPAEDPQPQPELRVEKGGIPLVVFDKDGVLADTSRREHFLHGGTPDWDAFYAASVDDQPIEAGLNLFCAMEAAGYKVGVVTGQSLKYARECRQWFEAHGINPPVLVMRDADDRSPSWQFKSRAIEAIEEAGYRVVYVVDDDRRVCDAVQASGIQALHFLGHTDIGTPIADKLSEEQLRLRRAAGQEVLANGKEEMQGRQGQVAADPRQQTVSSTLEGRETRN